MDLMYRGKVDFNRRAQQQLILTLKSGSDRGCIYVLNRRCTHVLLQMRQGWTNVKGSVTGNKLTIVAEDKPARTDTISWMVIGERKDNNVVSSEVTDDNGDLIVETR